ncbi:phosphoglycerate dehydrogenase [Paractinoplanes rhizophilus]|jgi:phosphoglycerate dehydrogenase-like enzyme|uniref:Phosphoglycerate dehydrogenase n=1 Tax=Paractinoplanes rhizophilus TaxID=1416877 RepID=A0ABW2I390_9ACTN|nr:phosphoglycerate dehydrogenase [Actinoplanes sp.]
MKVLLPDNVDLSDLTLPEGVSYAVDQPVPEEHTDAEVLVVWGNPESQLRDAAARMKRLRWVQTLAAGPDAVLAAGFAPGVLVTSGRGLHDRTVAEHTLALVLAAARRLNLMARAQIGHRWAGELGGNQPLRDRGNFRTVRDAHIVIWGFGSIAAAVSPLLIALGARVTGVARTPGARHGVEVVTEAEFPALLPTADVLISILPATPATRHAFNASVAALLPRHAWFVNVGRGATVDEAALLAAIRSGRLAGAALDVTEVEPLPPSSPLWDEPNIIISPHAAGGRPLGAPELIRSNLAAFREGRPLRNLVARP